MASLRDLDPPVSSAAVAIDHGELVGQSQQALCVPYQQVTAGSKAAIELFNQPSLLRLVEIHHHVAAENHVIALGQKFSLQIVKVEVDQLLHRFFHRIA